MYNTAQVEFQEQVLENIFVVRLRAPGIAQLAKAGQFAMLRGWDTLDPLLARPFSFHRILAHESQVEFVYRVVGRGTTLMSKWRPGDEVKILGPLGSGFPIPSGRSIAIVGRGMGIAPLYSLAETARESKVAVHSFLSARSSGSLIDHAALAGLSESMSVCTDDGSAGPPGLVTDSLKTAVHQYGISAIYCCGSKRLAREVSGISASFNIPSYVSLEERMGCGVGACKGCPVQTRVGYKMVCKDGPVFDLSEVLL